MKEIMVSIKPEDVAKILNGEKTIEIRKNKPNCELPCKVYIYETTKKVLVGQHFERSKSLSNFYAGNKAEYVVRNDYYYGKGKVVAEFTLDDVGEFYVFENGSVQGWNWFGLKKSCLTYEQISEYIGLNKKGYAWHIDNLKIYDKPKELSEFNHWVVDCQGWFNINNKENVYALEFIKRPPRNWCYVEKNGVINGNN